VNYVPEDPLRLSPGLAEMLSIPEHYRRTEMAVVDYAAGPVADDQSGWALLPCDRQPASKPNRLQRLRALLRKAKP
jgi:hypothetical protein